MSFSVDGILNNSKIAIEKAASDKFGAVVDDFVKGSLGGTGLIPRTETIDRRDGSWYSTSYAAALAGGTSYRPKLKFLFKVKFNFNQAALNAYGGRLSNSAKNNEFTFMIKSVDRPKVDFEYEEDVNMYNFRTKVLKRISHKELTIVFLDDSGNKVFDFFRDLMMIHSPITYRQLQRDAKDGSSTGLQTPSPVNFDSGAGMSFSQDYRNSANRQVVNSTFGNSIDSIQVQQIFVDPSKPLSNALSINSFDFMNPRIMSFDFDELSHEANEPSALTMVFDYDWMEMVKVGAQSSASMQNNTQTVISPGVHGAPSDVSPSGNPVPLGGNSVVGDISSIPTRGAGTAVQDIVGKAITRSLGNSVLGTAVAGKVSSVLSGIATSASRNVIGNLGNSLSRASAAPVKDAAVFNGPTSGSVKSVPSSDSYGNSNPGTSV